MFGFTTDVSNNAETDRIANAARTLLARVFSAATSGGALINDAALPAGDYEVTVSNLAAATGYMAWRS
jgi:hypothetical protein